MCGKPKISFYSPPLVPSRAFGGARRAVRPLVWVATETLRMWSAAATGRNDLHMMLV